MKNKFKNYLKLGIFLFGISFILSNCNKDDEIIKKVSLQKQNNRIKVKNISTQELFKNEKIASKLFKVFKNNKGISGRNIYNSTYDFSIDTDNVKYIENQETNYHSYNFAIHKESSITENIETLLLSSTEDGNYETYIVTYPFTKLEYQNIDFDILSSLPVSYELIDFDTSVFTSSELNNKISYECSELWTWSAGGEHDDGQLHGADCNCNSSGGEWVVFISCSYVDTGGGDTGTDSNTGSTTSGGGGTPTGTGTDNTDTSNNPTATPDDIIDIHGVIAIPVVQATPQEQHIVNLTTLTNHQQIKTKINELFIAVDQGVNLELGFQATDNLDGTYSFEPGIPSPDGHGLAFPLASTEAVLEGHIHNDGTGQTRVFSHNDIFGIATLFKAHQNPNVTVLLVTENQNIMYAMRVNDATKALAFFDKYYNVLPNGDLNLDKLKNKWLKEVYDIVNTDCNPAPACSEVDLNQELANFLSDEDTGVTLFEATIHPQQQTNSFTLTWGIVVPTP